MMTRRERYTLIGMVSILVILIALIVTVSADAAGQEPPFVRITYLCYAPEDGWVEEYAGGGEFRTVEVEAGDHLWRIRHEKGDATSFATNFLATVNGFINPGEILFFATPQHANGVKVITSPLANLYKGTASVSGKQCTYVEEPPEDPDPPVLCDPENYIWVWEIYGEDGLVGTLRDRTYDGTYSAPSLSLQQRYFGCDFYPTRVGGHWVNDCEAQFDYWDTLPCWNGLGTCP